MMSRLPLNVTTPSLHSNELYNIQINHLPVTAEKIRYETENDPELKVVLGCLANNEWTEKA